VFEDFGGIVVRVFCLETVFQGFFRFWCVSHCYFIVIYVIGVRVVVATLIWIGVLVEDSSSVILHWCLSKPMYPEYYGLVQNENKTLPYIIVCVVFSRYRN